MAKALRIDSWIVGGDGKVTITYTAGTAPLPASRHGTGRIYGSVQDIKDSLNDVDAREILETLFLIGMARFRQVSPAMTNGALIAGKTITFDVTQPANMVVIS